MGRSKMGGNVGGEVWAKQKEGGLEKSTHGLAIPGLPLPVHGVMKGLRVFMQTQCQEVCLICC